MTRAFIPLIAIASLTLAGCEVQPGDAAHPNQNRNAGAIGGALAGAAAGNIIGGSTTSTLLGAAAGAMLGAGIGTSLDKQAAELRQSLGGNATVTNTGSNLVVNFPEDVLFATNSSTVNSSQRSTLASLARSLNQYPNSTVQVLGYTDNTGTAAYNMDLSSRRAGAVASVLVSNGVSGSRLSVQGKGEDQPVASNDTASGRAQNRRVAVVINPTQ